MKSGYKPADLIRDRSPCGTPAPGGRTEKIIFFDICQFPSSAGKVSLSIHPIAIDMRNLIILYILATCTVPLTSCTKSEPHCVLGHDGKGHCKEDVIATYYNTYKGNGSDNIGSPPYSNYTLTASKAGADIMRMHMVLKNALGDTAQSFYVTMSSTSEFSIESYDIGHYYYWGKGTINDTVASLTLYVSDNNDYWGMTATFPNMLKQ
jgi:hypothetical protein